MSVVVLNRDIAETKMKPSMAELNDERGVKMKSNKVMLVVFISTLLGPHDGSYKSCRTKISMI